MENFFLDQNKVLDVIYFFQRLNSTLDNVLHILPDKIMNIETTKRPLRSTDNVHLEFLLGSVRRSPARRRSSKRNESRSTPPTPPYSLRGQEARGAKDRWKWAAREISRGYYLRSHIEIVGMRAIVFSWFLANLFFSLSFYLSRFFLFFTRKINL